MVEIFGKYYYIDLNEITNRCKTEPPISSDVKSDEGDEIDSEGTINIFKYEILKMCIERILNEFDESDESVGAFASKDTTVSFRIAFNTLIKNNILIEDDE